MLEMACKKIINNETLCLCRENGKQTETEITTISIDISIIFSKTIVLAEGMQFPAWPLVSNTVAKTLYLLIDQVNFTGTWALLKIAIVNQKDNMSTTHANECASSREQKFASDNE